MMNAEALPCTHSATASKLSLIAAVAVFACSQISWAQPMSHHAPRLTAHGTEILSKTETSPLDDAVLAVAPEQISLNFPMPVRLVKLVLRNQARDWVDIKFRYNPRPNDQYALLLPQLPEADYYTADWAILGESDELIRGSFSFAFGADKEPPSIQMEAERLLMELRYGDPEIQYVPPPRTTIILPQDDPNYDPPFTIRLEPDQ
jgi:methionine-rich copper-binding protein CopC